MSGEGLTIAQLREEIATSSAKAAFDVIVDGFSALGGLTLIAHHKGFINTLRILRGDEYCFSSIPNDEWVLACIRKPELRRGRLTPEEVLVAFPDAHVNSKGEVALRIRDAATASRWLEMIRAAGPVPADP
ncbi:hypothetical protein LHP98_12160 [Rhodobacter sp. Har01]|uniref:hypothetical protein n=1 Tax=Rhodobacter sp. Har01 TaxID=2883999 RepID=UPI001D0929E0|nr:hypothetical protein [Rhodobacter sp. Har01]MCB6178880.1 hypothetical protein [Rhodobacter sp. Har01]